MIFINSGASQANRNAAARSASRSASNSRSQQQRRRVPSSSSAPHQSPQPHSLPHSIRISLTDLKNSEIDKLVQERLSVPYIIVHCLLLILCSISLIALQITGLVVYYKTNYSASGIWVGSFYIVTAGITFLLVKWKKFRLMLLSAALHFLGGVIAIFGTIFYNVIGLLIADTSKNYYILNVVMMVLGGICICASFIYLFYFRFRILLVHRIVPVRQTIAVAIIADHPNGVTINGTRISAQRTDSYSMTELANINRANNNSIYDFGYDSSPPQFDDVSGSRYQASSAPPPPDYHSIRS